MTIREACLKEEAEFPKLFADYEEKAYGILFYKETAKDSHDSNHAILYPDKIDDLERVILEIRDFYLHKHLVPRIYHPFQTGYFAANREIFERLGFTIELYEDSKFMLLTGENTIVQSGRLQIKRMTEWEDAIATDLYLPEGEPHAVEVEKLCLKQSNYYLFCGFLGKKIVALLSMHLSKYGCTRFDDILIALKHRSQGYAKEMIGFAVAYCRQNHLPNCFQWPICEFSERACTAAGFSVAFEAPAGSAVYDPAPRG